MRIKRKAMPLLALARIKKGTRVIVRADLDVGIMRGSIQDSLRMRALMPTLRMLIRAGARIRVIGHLGRPGGRRNAQLSLAPVGRTLASVLRRHVIFVPDPFSKKTREQYGDAKNILLFENLRFWPGEQKNTPSFAAALAQWGEVYVNEAFANSHRAHASMVGLPGLLPACAGLHLEEEINALERVMENPARPLVAVFGGAKIETKLPLIQRFLREADQVLVGGALANTLFAAAGKNVGKSLAEKNIKKGTALIFRSQKLRLPSDVLVAPALRAGALSRVRAAQEVRADDYIVDIGPMTQDGFAEMIGRARTVVWNGPMGFAEVPAFAKGTIAVARAVGRNKGFTVVGGGDTLALLSRYRLVRGFGYVSMGGGAMLEFLSGKELPAIKALRK